MATPASLTLNDAILNQLLPKLPNMTIAQIVKYTVRSTLKQMTQDYEMDYEHLKQTYLEDGADYYEVAAPVGFTTGSAGAPLTKVTETAIVPASKTAQAPTSLSKMKKEDLIRVCQELDLDIDGTVPELRTRIKDAGGLPTGSASSAVKALPGPDKPKGSEGTRGAGGASKPKKPKVPALITAGELTEEPMDPKPKSSKSKTEKPKGASKSKKADKPVHSHPIDEISPECQVCETYGNPLAAFGRADPSGSLADPEPEDDTEADYVEETKTLRERLNMLLASEAAGDGDDTEEDEAEEEAEEEEEAALEE